MAERVGFYTPFFPKPFCLRDMPKYAVFTGIFVVSHLSHPSQKNLLLTTFTLFTVWMVWMRFVASRHHVLKLKKSGSVHAGSSDRRRSPAFVPVILRDDSCFLSWHRNLRCIGLSSRPGRVYPYKDWINGFKPEIVTGNEQGNNRRDNREMW